MTKDCNKPIHALQVLGRLDTGGVESRQMDLLENIDRSKIQFDFMIHTNDKCAYEDKAISLGAKIYRVPRFKFYNIRAYKKAWNDFFDEHPEIKIVHGHMTSTAGIYLPIAKRHARFTIAHVRNAGVEKGLKGILTNLLRLNLINKCDQAFACSRLAGKAVYGEKALNDNRVIIFNNAIDSEHFKYNEEYRKEIRDKYNIKDDTYVIGNVGRLDYQKNHKYMVQILSELKKLEPNVKMIFVGEGNLTDEIIQQAKALNVYDDIVFAGRTHEVYKYYQAFDCFILPSFFEGLPGVAVEAQAAGLTTIISDLITDEVLITDLASQKSISIPAIEWANEILKHKNASRRDYTLEVKEAGFDVHTTVKWLENYYENIISSK